MYGARGFPAPLFDNEFVVVEQRLVKDRHLEASTRSRWPLVRCGLVFPHRTSPGTVRLAYRPVVDDYMGERRLQLVIEHAAL